MKLKTIKGFTLIEMLAVISIIVILSAIVLPSLSSFKKEQALKNATADIVSLLNKAKSDADSRTVATDYGVHFESDKATYFVGSTFTESDASNQQVDIDPSVIIPASGGINLDGGGSSVVFTRLTGDNRGYVLGYGTIILQLASDPTRQKIITINRTGSVSIN